MFNIGAGEMVLIMVAALLILGPTRLPELARGLGKFMREFRRQTDEVRNVVEREFYTMDQEIGREPPAPIRPGTPFAYNTPSSPIGPPEGPALPAPGSPLLGAPEGIVPGMPDALAEAPAPTAPGPGPAQVLEMDVNGPRELEASALHEPAAPAAPAEASAEPVAPTPDTPVPVPGTVARNASKRS